MHLSEFCGTPFWNSSTSWDAQKPYISQCFQNLVLVLGSCGVLWLVAPFEFVKIHRSRGIPTPWTKLSITKMSLKGILLLICTVDVAKATYSYVNYSSYGVDGLIAASSYFLTIVLTVILTMMCKNRGLRVSLVLPSFWMLSTLTTLISIYNDIQDFQSDDWTSVTSLVDDSLVFTVSVIQLIISNIADKASSPHARESQEQCPLEGVSLPSRLTFSWLISLFSKSIQNRLHQNFLLPLCYELKSSTVSKAFRNACNISNSEESHPSTLGDTENLIDNRAESRERINSCSSYPKGKNLLAILLKVARKFLIIASILEVIYTSLYFLPAYILSLLLGNKNERQEWHNYLYATALFITLLFSALADSQRKYYGLMAAIRIKTAVMNAIFEKAFKVSKEAVKIKLLITTDSDNVFQMICMMTEIWGAPLRVLIGIYVLWSFLGSSCFVGIAVAALLIPVNVIVEQCASYFQNKAYEKKRERLDMIVNCLQGMKVVKFYAWEDIFLKKISALRKLELAEIRKAEFLKITFKFVILTGTSVVTLATLTAYVLMGNTLDAKTVFVSFSLIGLLKTPFRSILHLMAHFIQGLTSVSEIQNFLENKELVNELTTDEDLAGNSVQLTNASFSYDGKDTCLKNLNLHIPKGSLIAVVGETKSGKSSLLRALLGELEKVDGAAQIAGSVAFVSDKPWIQNLTLEKNILFLNTKDAKLYNKILEACSLHSDIDSLPAGDETEIGEMGVHLSLDQKFKVDLAKSVYQNSDVYLLDDPLRYMNNSLSEHLFQRVIGRSGLLKEKTRILTSVREEFLPLVDFIVLLKDGRIVEQGTYSELKEKNGYFSEYLKNPQPRRAIPKDQSNEQEYIRNTDDFGSKSDLWYSTMVSPAKMELEGTVCDEALVTTKGLGSKLRDLIKTVGFISIVFSILLAGLACSCEAASGVWLSEWTDGNGSNLNSNYKLTIYSGFILSQVFLTIMCGILVFTSTTITAGKLHPWLLHQIMRASQINIEMTPVRKIIKSFDRDFHYADEKIAETFYVWLIAALKSPALLVVIFVVSPYLTVLTVPLIFAFLVIQKLFLNSWHQLQYLTIATSCPLSSLLEETLRGASQIRATRSSSHFFERFRLKLDTHNNCTLIFLLASRWLNCSADIIASFLVLLTTVMAYYEGDKCSGFIGLAIVYSMQIAENLTTMVYMSSMLSNDLTAFGRLKGFSQLKQESEWKDPTSEPSPSWPQSGEILVQNLSTTGEGMSPLHDVNISIKPGEKVAIVGKEESGASTLLYSLFRLIEPSEGQIVIDDVNISNLGLQDLRSKLAIVPQDALIFDGTIRQNLDPYKEYRDDELWSAMEISTLKNKISNLDAAIESWSEEEKNLISITRCILKKPKIVILDEPSQLSEPREQIFHDSTVLTFCGQPLPDFSGRIIRLLSGEIVDEEFPTV